MASDNNEDDLSASSIDWSLSASTSRSSDESESDASDDIDSVLFSSTANPTEITYHAWVYIYSPKKLRSQHALGKWLVFRPFTLLDKTWHIIRKAIEAGQLSEYVTEAKCSTMLYLPDCSGPGPKTGGVICVYTTEENVDKAGHILIKIVEHDIKYKTDEATLDGNYTWKNGGQSVCMKTLYWNDGYPSCELKGKTCYGPSQKVVDQWHLNVATAPKSLMSACEVYGRWVVAPDFNELTVLWHMLKKMIESGNLGPVEMVCPPKVNRLDPNEDIVFFLYTAYKNKEFVGVTVATVVGKDIVYQLGRSAIRESETGRVTYNHRVIWNDGEPVYVMNLLRHRSRQQWNYRHH